MLRGLAILAVCVLFLSGCADAPDAVDPVAEADAAAPVTDMVVFEGSYDGLVLQGEQVQGSGGDHEILVDGAGWTDVLVRLDVGVETILHLLPPGCAVGEACDITLESPSGNTDLLGTVPAMEPGTWTTAMEVQGEQARYAGSVYTLTLEYTLAVADQASA